MPLNFERLSFLSRRVYENLKTYNKKLFATLPIALLMIAPTPNATERIVVPAINYSTIAPAVALVTTSPLPVTSPVKISTIVPGESVNDRDARLAAEAAAAKALAAQKAAQARKVIAVSTVADPANFDELYRAAGAAYGVDPMILKAVHIVETGASGSTSRSNPSGATGPMQFLPSTFRNHAVDGNGDGVLDVHNVSDAVYTAARYLHDCGYPDVKKALWGYNPSTSYCNRVINLAKSFGFQG